MRPILSGLLVPLSVTARSWRPAVACVLAVSSLGLVGCRGPWKWPQFSRKNSPVQAEELARQARHAANRGDTASAEYLLAAAVAANPRDCETRLELSEMLFEHGNLDAAAEHLRKVVDENPQDARGHVRLAQALFLKHDLAGAKTQASEGLDCDPANAQGWLLSARIEHLENHDKEALAACYRALSAEPGLSPAKLLAAELHLAQGHPEQATPLLRSLMEQSAAPATQRTEAAWLLGLSYGREGRWSDAAAELKKAIAQRGDSAADWYQLAYACYRAGDVPGSQRAVDKALAISPAHAESTALRRLLKNGGSPATAGDATPVHQTAHITPGRPSVAKDVPAP